MNKLTKPTTLTKSLWPEPLFQSALESYKEKPSTQRVTHHYDDASKLSIKVTGNGILQALTCEGETTVTFTGTKPPVITVIDSSQAAVNRSMMTKR